MIKRFEELQTNDQDQLPSEEVRQEDKIKFSTYLENIFKVLDRKIENLRIVSTIRINEYIQLANSIAHSKVDLEVKSLRDVVIMKVLKEDLEEKKYRPYEQYSPPSEKIKENFMFKLGSALENFKPRV